MNQVILAYLRNFISYTQDDWADWTPLAATAVNGRKASATGLTPFFCMHGWDYDPIQIQENLPSSPSSRSPRSVGEGIVAKIQAASDYAQASIAAAQEYMERQANKGRQEADSFKVGDKVWLNMKNVKTLRPSKKLDWKNLPYTITRVLGSHTYELDVPRSIHNRFHASLLRRAFQDPLPSQRVDFPEPGPILGDSGEPEYFVERIIYAKGPTNNRRVLIQWVGWAEPTWEPLSNVVGTEALSKFEEEFGPVMGRSGYLGPPELRPRSKTRK